MSRGDTAGSNSLRTKKLAPGHYKAIFTVTDAAGSTQRAVKFRVR